ncbi:hypothetical protein GWI33_004691 [Rhynchophorus ferrugineus]|uniref:Peptidase S1 domain-containing protein n=1 Tax=Rhynchophorus ferrugineus TaxID=354439 RepID=A0A834J2S1_RHYFE|nr:hypothetical protein GWI33_004691 [Rhynchophorus ferrugineus]
MAIILILLICGTVNLVTAQVADFLYPFNHLSSQLRIVGGQDASAKQFPFQTGLYISYQLKSAFCGGSLISENYVLTAAHCLEGALSINVVLGALNISDESEPGRQSQTTTSYTIHPQWDSSYYKNDVGVVRLSSPAILNEYVQKITVASGVDTYANQQGTVIGWGKTYDDQQTLTDILQYVSNKIYREGNKGFCQGDSGGPLISNGVQVGIVSFSYKSCQVSMPSVFARVSEFSEWIKDNTDIV